MDVIGIGYTTTVETAVENASSRVGLGEGIGMVENEDGIWLIVEGRLSSDGTSPADTRKRPFAKELSPIECVPVEGSGRAVESGIEVVMMLLAWIAEGEETSSRSMKMQMEPCKPPGFMQNPLIQQPPMHCELSEHAIWATLEMADDGLCPVQTPMLELVVSTVSIVSSAVMVFVTSDRTRIVNVMDGDIAASNTDDNCLERLQNAESHKKIF